VGSPARPGTVDGVSETVGYTITGTISKQCFEDKPTKAREALEMLVKGVKRKRKKKMPPRANKPVLKPRRLYFQGELLDGTRVYKILSSDRKNPVAYEVRYNPETASFQCTCPAGAKWRSGVPCRHVQQAVRRVFRELAPKVKAGAAKVNPPIAIQEIERNWVAGAI